MQKGLKLTSLLCRRFKSDLGRDVEEGNYGFFSQDRGSVVAVPTRELRCGDCVRDGPGYVPRVPGEWPCESRADEGSGVPGPRQVRRRRGAPRRGRRMGGAHGSLSSKQGQARRWEDRAGRDQLTARGAEWHQGLRPGVDLEGCERRAAVHLYSVPQMISGAAPAGAAP